jgi:rod shape-determining protein MreC
MKFRPTFLVLVIIIFLSFFTSKVLGPFKYLSYPYDLLSLVSSRMWQNVTDIYQTVTWKKKRIESLETEVSNLAERLIEYENIKRENILLKELLGLKDSQKKIVTFARVIRRGLSRWSSAVVIDKGEKDGVRKDMAVITSRGLVGKVIAVNRDFSEILLLDDSNFRVAVRFMGSRAEGIASGTGYGVIVRYVSKEAEVINNDWVITSGLDGIFPEGLLVGYVTDIKEQGFFNEVSLRTSQNLRGLEFVCVVSR